MNNDPAEKPLNAWAADFRRLYEKAANHYSRGASSPGEVVPEESDRRFLAANGLRPINIFDYIEDTAKGGEPGYDTALLIASARREYFLFRQHGQWSDKAVGLDDLPPKTDAIDGIVWLPRIMPKARAFLRGELAEDIMFCSGGDRKFFKENKVNPVDFLRVVESAGDDAATIIDFIKSTVENGGSFT